MGISSICLIIIILLVGIYFFGQTTGDHYGNRLTGIENVPIDSDRIEEIETAIMKNEIVDQVSIRLRGKIVHINVWLSGGSVAEAQAIGTKTLEVFSDDENAFYDLSFSFDLTDRPDVSQFPIQGYIKSDNSVISWTNISEEE